MSLEVRVLGPVAPIIDGTEVDVGGVQARAVLALLAINHDRVVRLEELIDRLWPDEPPATASKTVQVYISRLRHALRTESSHLSRVGPGYVMRLGREGLDADRFRDVVAAAERAKVTNPSGACELLEAGLGIWSGPALADLQHLPFARREAQSLDEIRLQATENLMELRIEAGEFRAVIPKLQALVEEEGARERLWILLMRSLYYDGQQRAALSVYHDARARLANEVGIDPSRELQQLQAAILRQELATPGGTRPRQLGADRVPARSKLPFPMSTFIDRTRETVELRDLLDNNRLVTVVGPGGTGKTRLAIEVAHLAERDVGTGWFVDLTQAASAADVPGVLAEAFGVSVVHPESDTDAMVRFIDGRNGIVVVDNMEHVIEAAVTISRLAEAAPNVRFLVTSRTPLRIRGEHVFNLLPLPTVPDGSADESPAVALLKDRAQAAGFHGGDPAGDRVAMDAMARLVDGIPLAIELVAGRLAHREPAETLRSLDRQLDVLVGGPRDAPRRHQTMSAAIEWSFRLLNENDQAGFASLAPFDSFDSESAQAVVGDSGPGVIDRLAECNLVNVHRTLTLPFSLSIPVREYALQELDRRGSSNDVWERYCTHLVDVAERAESGLLGPDQGGWFVLLRAHHANMRIALEWLYAHGRAEPLHRMVGALWWFWRIDGSVREGLRWCAAARAANAVDGRESARLDHTDGMLSLSNGEYERAAALLESAAEKFEMCGDREGTGRCLNGLGWVSLARGDVEMANARFAEAVELARQCGSPTLELWVLGNQTSVLAMKDDLEGALANDTVVRRRAHEIGDVEMEGLSTIRSHWFAFLGGNDAARRDLRPQALERARDAADPEVELLGLSSIATADAIEGNLQQSGSLLHRGSRLVADATPSEVSGWLEAAAWHLLRGADVRGATTLLGAIDAMSSHVDAPYPALLRLRDRARDIARAQMGQGDFEATLDFGASLEPDAAVSFALRLLGFVEDAV